MISSRNTSGGTLVEIVAMITIVILGIITTLDLINSGRKLSINTENKIQAINIAREGIEGVSNIRDTNWTKFSSDRKNCWNTKDYSVLCIANTSLPHAAKIATGSYTLYESNGLWYLSGITTGVTPDTLHTTNWTGYKTRYKIMRDTIGYTNQTGAITAICNNNSISTGCILPFSREIHLSYRSTGSLNIKSIVRWQEAGYSGSASMKSIILSTDLTNWKEKF